MLSLHANRVGPHRMGTRMTHKGLFAAGIIVLMPGLALAQACYESSIMSPTPFMGNHGEIFKLADGSLWEVQYEYEYMYEYYPTVIVCPSRGKLVVGGKTLSVQQVAAGRPPSQPRSAPAAAEFIETRIDGEFSGWEGETVFKLENGQIWQQASYAYMYSYKYRPKVLIFRTRGGYEMQVEGVSNRIRVTRLK
jgi:hypothetical protein